MFDRQCLLGGIVGRAFETRNPILLGQISRKHTIFLVVGQWEKQIKTLKVYKKKRKASQSICRRLWKVIKVLFPQLVMSLRRRVSSGTLGIS